LHSQCVVDGGIFSYYPRSGLFGDEITLNFPMQPRTVAVRPEVKDDAGKFAVEYGPLVYCIKETDNPGTFDKQINPQSLSVTWQPGLLGGVNIIHDKEFTLIPYYNMVESRRGKDEGVF
jgi:DUF1680 family protein